MINFNGFKTLQTEIYKVSIYVFREIKNLKQMNCNNLMITFVLMFLF